MSALVDERPRAVRTCHVCIRSVYRNYPAVWESTAEPRPEINLLCDAHYHMAKRQKQDMKAWRTIT